MVSRRGSLARFAMAFCAACGLGTACSPPAKMPTMIADESSGPLAHVILLPLTTRSTDDLLGHAWSAETDTADPMRAVLSGTAIVTNTDQHITFLREASTAAELNANRGVANAGARVSHVTHLLYDVRIAAIATFATGSQRYNAESGCCLQGNPSEQCEFGYVYRLLRGSGTIKMLQRLGGEVSANFKSVIMARGGANYRVVDESTFNDAYFGLELMPLENVCRTLTPEQEMAPLQLKAAPNCVIHRYAALGEKEVLARHLPNEELCRSVAERYCSELSGLLSCRVRFGDANEQDVTQRPAPPAAEAPAPKPAGAEIRKRK